MYLITYNYSLGSSMEMCSISGYYPEPQNWNYWLKLESITGILQKFRAEPNFSDPAFAYFWVSLKSNCSPEDWELEGWISHSYFSGKVETYWDNTPAQCHSKSSRKFRAFHEYKPAQLSCHTGKTCGIKFTSQMCLFVHLHLQLAQGTKIFFWWSWDLSHGASHENFWYQNSNIKIAIIQSYWIFFFRSKRDLGKAASREMMLLWYPHIPRPWQSPSVVSRTTLICLWPGKALLILSKSYLHEIIIKSVNLYHTSMPGEGWHSIQRCCWYLSD